MYQTIVELIRSAHTHLFSRPINIGLLHSRAWNPEVQPTSKHRTVDEAFFMTTGHAWKFGLGRKLFWSLFGGTKHSKDNTDPSVKSQEVSSFLWNMRPAYLFNVPSQEHVNIPN